MIANYTTSDMAGGACLPAGLAGGVMYHRPPGAPLLNARRNEPMAKAASAALGFKPGQAKGCGRCRQGRAFDGEAGKSFSGGVRPALLASPGNLYRKRVSRSALT